MNDFYHDESRGIFMPLIGTGVKIKKEVISMKRIDGKTPSGGDYAEFHFLDTEKQ